MMHPVHFPALPVLNPCPLERQRLKSAHLFKRRGWKFWPSCNSENLSADSPPLRSSLPRTGPIAAS